MKSKTSKVARIGTVGPQFVNVPSSRNDTGSVNVLPNGVPGATPIVHVGQRDERARRAVHAAADRVGGQSDRWHEGIGVDLPIGRIATARRRRGQNERVLPRHGFALAETAAPRASRAPSARGEMLVPCIDDQPMRAPVSVPHAALTTLSPASSA